MLTPAQACPARAPAQIGFVLHDRQPRVEDMGPLTVGKVPGEQLALFWAAGHWRDAAQHSIVSNRGFGRLALFCIIVRAGDCGLCAFSLVADDLPFTGYDLPSRLTAYSPLFSCMAIIHVNMWCVK